MEESGMQRVRVLHVLGGLWCGGTEAFVMNVYRTIDRRKVEFIFLIHEQEKAHYDDEVLALGGTIIRIPDRKESGVVRYVYNLLRSLHQIKPDVIHAHAMFNSGIVMIAAFMARISKRVCHSHSTNDQDGDRLTRRMFRMVMRSLIRLFSTDYMACNEEAAQFLFGSAVSRKGTAQILYNGIDLKPYLSVSEEERESVRKELDLPPDSFIIGIVSRLVEIKNPLFIIHLFQHIRRVNEHAYLVIAGEGPLKVKIEQELKRMHLDPYARLTGNRKDVPVLMTLFDVFVMPSLFEGLSIAALEAQASGIPCVVSDGVSRTTDVGLGLMHYVSIADESRWIQEIAKSKHRRFRDRQQIKVAFMKKGYDAQSASQTLLQVYEM